MSGTIRGADVADAVRRASQALVNHADYLTSLDQAMGDGDMGITMHRIGAALIEFVEANAVGDIGRYLYQLGTVINKTAPSSMGTLTAAALMSAGKAVRDKTELNSHDLAIIFRTVVEDIQARGKAKLGDKTIVDALHPASEAYVAAIESGASLQEAATAAVQAAETGRDAVTPLRSKVGRASWVGERTEGKLDPGCAMFVLVLKALAAV